MEFKSTINQTCWTLIVHSLCSISRYCPMSRYQLEVISVGGLRTVASTDTPEEKVMFVNKLEVTVISPSSHINKL